LRHSPLFDVAPRRLAVTTHTMDQFAKETLPISLEEEMRRSYLDYAMSVIVGARCPTCVMD